MVEPPPEGAPRRTLRGPPGRRVVVCGPPAAGKTTYVQRHRRPGDIVWDFDVIAEAVTGRELYAPSPELIPLFQSMRDALVRWLTIDRPVCRAFIIVTRPDVARRLAAQLGAVVVMVLATEAECVRRLEYEPARAPRRAEQIAAVGHWFTRFGGDIDAWPAAGKVNGGTLLAAAPPERGSGS